MAFAGTTWLVSGGELPWTPEDIREHLRLSDPSFDDLIRTVIFSECNRLGVGFRDQVWAVARGDDLAAFYAKANSLGKLVKIGPAYLRGKVTYHDCEVGPDPAKARKAFRSIINWCWDDDAISRAIINERRGVYRTPIVRGADLSPAVAAERAR